MRAFQTRPEFVMVRPDWDVQSGRVRFSRNTHTSPILLMSILSFLKSQALEVIEWTDDSRDTLSYRFPDDDKAIKRGAQLIVRESQAVQFVYLGQFADLYGPGKHTLTTENIPILTKLASWKYNFESPFKTDIYYVVTRTFTGNKWGTSNPVMLRDADYGVVRARAFGTYDFKIVNPAVFLKEVAGTDNHFRLDEFADTMRSRLVSVFSEAMAESRVPILDMATRYSELGGSLIPLINLHTGPRYGLEITGFVVENVSLPPEVEQAIDKRTSMTAIGNLNDYVKLQMAQHIGTATAPSAASWGAEVAMGAALAQQVFATSNPAGAVPPSTAPTAVSPAPGNTAPATPTSTPLDLLSPADAAKLLGVAESDVLESIAAGDIKAKKIGSTFRITRTAIDEFLKA